MVGRRKRFVRVHLSTTKPGAAAMVKRPLLPHRLGNLRRNVLTIALTVPAALLLSSCNQDGQAPATPVADASAAEQISQLKWRVSSLEHEVQALQTWQDSQVSDAESAKTADVITTTPQYDSDKTRFGTFLVRSQSIKPFLDGYQVRLGIGNLTSFTFSGAKIHVKWGAEQDRQSVFDVTNQLLPGSWSTVLINLSPAKASDVKLLLVSLELNEVVAPAP